MLATVETASGWWRRNPLNPADGALTAVSLNGDLAIIEAIPCWLDHTGNPCVPNGDDKVLRFVQKLTGGGPFARTHLPGWTVPALLFGRTVPHLWHDEVQAERTAGQETGPDGRVRSPIEINRTPMWLIDVPPGDPALTDLEELAMSLGDTCHETDLAPAEDARLIVPAAAPRWN